MRSNSFIGMNNSALVTEAVTIRMVVRPLKALALMIEMHLLPVRARCAARRTSNSVWIQTEHTIVFIGMT